MEHWRDISKAMAPQRREIIEMASRLVDKLGREVVMAWCGTTEETLDVLLGRRRNANKNSDIKLVRLIWVLHCILHDQKKLATMDSMLTWGAATVEAQADEDHERRRELHPPGKMLAWTRKMCERGPDESKKLHPKGGDGVGRGCGGPGGGSQADGAETDLHCPDAGVSQAEPIQDRAPSDLRHSDGLGDCGATESSGD